jgi:hypothetical protein
MSKSNPFDEMLDAIHYPTKIKADSYEVLKHVTDLPELKDNWKDEQKLAAIEKVYQKLSDPAHPVSIAMTKKRDIPEIRIIEGNDNK